MRYIAIFSAFALLLMFCFHGANLAGIDSDVISPFSFSNDLLQGVRISTWNFPAPTFIFPDILVSIPIVFLFKTPEKWFYVASCLQWLALILIIMRHRKVNFPGVVYAGLLVSKLGDYYFGPPWQAIASRMFVLVNHMSASLLALGVYLWLSSVDFKLKKNNLIILLPLFFLSAFSDLFFMLYFFAFVAASILVSYRVTLGIFAWLRLMFLLFIIGCAGVGLNALINPNFFIQLHNSYQSVSVLLRFSNLLNILQPTGEWLFIGIPVVLAIITTISAIGRQQKLLIYSLLGGLLLFLLGVGFTGMIVDKYALRYLGIYFPVLVFVIAQLLPAIFYRYSMNIVVSILALFLAAKFVTRSLPLMSHLYSHKVLAVLDCPAFINNREDALVVATYWPAKILFEKSDRVFRLKQTGIDLTSVYHWIYNPSWMEGVTHKTLYVTIGASKQAITQIKNLPSAQVICDDSVILIDKNKRN